jgi:peptidoglycan-associated lipoprotein
VNSYVLSVITMAALASYPIVAERSSVLAQPRAWAPADTTLQPPPLLLTQAHPAPASPVRPGPAPESPIGLPPVKDYTPISELRDVHFDFGTAVIRPADLKILDANAAWLRANRGYLVLIEGHCDNRGAASRRNEFNMDLGERRAQAAMSHLVAQGVDPSRITTLSYGEERPQCTEESERCWRLNRRSRFLVKSR